MGREGHRTWPADILIPHWDLGKPAALDLSVTSTCICTLNSSTLMEVGVTFDLQLWQPRCASTIVTVRSAHSLAGHVSP